MISLSHSQVSSFIYSRSFDSRSRKPTESLSEYTLPLFDNLQRVRTIQLGSIYLPINAVQTINATQNNVVPFSEPVTIPLGSQLVLQETATSRDLTTGAVTTTVFPAVTVTPPPTLNPITSVDVAGVNVVASNTHGVQFALDHYASAGLTMYIAGGLYPAAATLAPVVSSGTVANVTGATTFDFNGGYLDSLVAGCHDERNTFGAYRSFLYAERPTLSQLLVMLNAELTRLMDSSNLAPTGTSTVGSPRFILDDATGTLRLSSEDVVLTVGNTQTTYSLQVLNTSSLLGLLGLGSGPLSPARTVSVECIPVVRFADLSQGTYSDVQTAALVADSLTPLNFLDPAAANRTLSLLDSGGVLFSVVIPQGHYSGTQLANVLTNLITTATGDANFTVTYAETVTRKRVEGRFTFSHSAGLPFTLDFTATPLIALELGFNQQVFSGASSYTSSTVAVSSSLAGEDFPCNVYGVQVDATSSMFTLASQATIASVSDITVGGAFNWATKDGPGGNDIVPGCYSAGEVLLVKLSGGGLPVGGLNAGDYLTVVVASGWDGTGGSAFVTLENTASLSANTLCGMDGIVFSGGPSPAIVASTTPLRSNNFQLHMGVDGAAAEMLGFPAQTVPALSALGQSGSLTALSSFYTAPLCYNITGPSYILMRLVTNCRQSTANEVVFGMNRKPILAKLYLRNGYLNISEQMLHVSLSGMRNIRDVKVRFENPDGSLVDFCADHTFSLLFTAEEGLVGAICP